MNVCTGTCAIFSCGSGAARDNPSDVFRRGLRARLHPKPLPRNVVGFVLLTCMCLQKNLVHPAATEGTIQNSFARAKGPLS
jgi:hypothetical protein